MFRLVQTAPRKGTVILYRSDLLHAGPDNRSLHPRRFFGMSIARDVIEHKYWHDGYSPHPTLTGIGVTWLYGFQFEIKVIAKLPETASS